MNSSIHRLYCLIRNNGPLLFKKLAYIILLLNMIKRKNSQNNEIILTTLSTFLIINFNINFKNLILRFISYPERWRDWPYETRQPAFFYKAAVPIPAVYVYILADERSAYCYVASFSVEEVFYFTISMLTWMPTKKTE